MFTASVADSLMPRSSDQRPDCGTSIRTTHLSPPGMAQLQACVMARLLAVASPA